MTTTTCPTGTAVPGTATTVVPTATVVPATTVYPVCQSSVVVTAVGTGYSC
ncbi:hypothetical protein [Sphaerisporangium rufum]|uniref:hypothetical protein n=1 Tax=Sphaerisporangium rufum TaxID=1381558 RepID=UPI001EF30C02|nr:hypothetical protein [Sphaerisporangium rufum]